MPFRPSVLAVVLVAPAVALAACSSGSSGSSAAAKPSTRASSSSASPTSSASAPAPDPSAAPTAVGPTTTSAEGVAVTGAFGQVPTLTIPGTAAPTKLATKVITAGTGKPVPKGQTLVANYVGETWAPKAGKPNVFDSSFAKGSPAGFPIGVGGVIPGWDQTLVGAKVGSRLLLTIPPALGYGAAKSAANELAGQTLVFVVDVLGGVAPGAAATGTPAPTPPATFPKITSASGKEPAVASVTGVKAPAAPTSALLLKGDGPAIDTGKALALQLVQTDVATGKKTQKTWGQAVQLVPAQQVLAVANALTGQKVGSRVVVLTPATPATAASPQGTEAAVLVIDVVGQF